MPPGALSLQIASPYSPQERSTYHFTCPSCCNPIDKQADRKIVSLLLSAGVEVVPGPPEGPTIAGQEVGTDAILTLDDAIDLHRDLEDDGALEEFLKKESKDGG